MRDLITGVKMLNLLRPTCPHCDGKGGWMDGYYQPEFYGCECCNKNEDNEADVTRVWRWRWWLFRYRQWREERRIDRLIAEDERRMSQNS